MPKGIRLEAIKNSNSKEPSKNIEKDLKDAGFSNAEISEEFGVVPINNNANKDYFNTVKAQLENEYYTQESTSPDDELLYQSKIDQADAPSLKEIVVGKEFDGDEILKKNCKDG